MNIKQNSFNKNERRSRNVKTNQNICGQGWEGTTTGGSTNKPLSYNL